MNLKISSAALNKVTHLYMIIAGCRYTARSVMITSSNGSIFRITGPLWRKPPVIGGFPSQRRVTWSLIFSLVCASTNGWSNNRDAGELRRHRAHYEASVMVLTWHYLRRGNWKVKSWIVLTSDPLHNLADLHKTLQHTTERFVGVLQGCVQCMSVRLCRESPVTRWANKIHPLTHCILWLFWNRKWYCTRSTFTKTTHRSQYICNYHDLLLEYPPPYSCSPRNTLARCWNKHDDVRTLICFPHNYTFVWGIHWFKEDSPLKGPIMRAIVVSFAANWTSASTTRRILDDLRCFNHVRSLLWNPFIIMGLMPNTLNCGLYVRRECRERFPRHRLAIPTCIMARARRTSCDACRDR